MTDERKDELKCGECGNETHTLTLIRKEYQPRLGGEGSMGTGTAIETTCTKCKSVSIIKISTPGFVTTGDSLMMVKSFMANRPSVMVKLIGINV